MTKSKKEQEEVLQDELKEEEVVEEEIKEPCEDKEEPPKEDWENKYLRLAADFMNYKKRSEKERQDTHVYANERLLSSLLEVLDSFDRAVSRGQDEEDPTLKGMVLIKKQLWTALNNAGLEEIQSLGTYFDPEFHDAFMLDDTAQMESGRITEVYEKGYIFHKKVLRHAKVKVAE